jgi:chromosome segregation ATPase
MMVFFPLAFLPGQSSEGAQGEAGELETEQKKSAELAARVQELEKQLAEAGNEKEKLAVQVTTLKADLAKANDKQALVSENAALQEQLAEAEQKIETAEWHSKSVLMELELFKDANFPGIRESSKFTEAREKRRQGDEGAEDRIVCYQDSVRLFEEIFTDRRRIIAEEQRAAKEKAGAIAEERRKTEEILSRTYGKYTARKR